MVRAALAVSALEYLGRRDSHRDTQRPYFGSVLTLGLGVVGAPKPHSATLFGE